MTPHVHVEASSPAVAHLENLPGFEVHALRSGNYFSSRLAGLRAAGAAAPSRLENPLSPRLAGLRAAGAAAPSRLANHFIRGCDAGVWVIDFISAPPGSGL